MRYVPAPKDRDPLQLSSRGGKRRGICSGRGERRRGQIPLFARDDIRETCGLKGVRTAGHCVMNLKGGGPEKFGAIASFFYERWAEPSLEPLHRRIASEIPVERGRLLDIGGGAGRDPSTECGPRAGQVSRSSASMNPRKWCAGRAGGVANQTSSSGGARSKVFPPARSSTSRSRFCPFTTGRNRSPVSRRSTEP